MGAFELEPFAAGTRAVAEAVAAGAGHHRRRRRRLRRRAGAVRPGRPVTHLSTGGGASLELLEGGASRGGGTGMSRRPPLIAGNWKMHKTVAEAEAFVAGAAAADLVGRRATWRLPALHRAARRWSTARGARAWRCSRQNVPRGGVGRVHRRDLGAHARSSSTSTARSSGTRSGASSSARPTGPSSRRSRRYSRPACGRSCAWGRPRRSARTARPSASCATRSGGRWPRWRGGPARRASSSPTSRSGRSVRAGSPPQTRPRRPSPSSAPWSTTARPSRPSKSASSTVAA